MCHKRGTLRTFCDGCSGKFVFQATRQELLSLDLQQEKKEATNVAQKPSKSSVVFEKLLDICQRFKMVNT
jgi:CDGSH-type Zn-finger protein